MGRLYIPIGILGSGKSTWAKKMVAENPDTKIVCPDAIRVMLHGTYQYMEGLDIAITNICKEAIRQLVKENCGIIVDCCNLGDVRRKGWIKASYIETVYRRPDHNSWPHCHYVPLREVKKVYQIIAVIFPNKDKSWHVDNAMKTEKGKLFDRGYWEKVCDLHKRQFEPVNEMMFDQVLRAEEL